MHGSCGTHTSVVDVVARALTSMYALRAFRRAGGGRSVLS